GSTVIAEKTWTPSLFQWHPKQGAYARYYLGVSDIVLKNNKKNAFYDKYTESKHFKRENT
uniref:hypothetical protein n=1 Tax=Phocaeicola sp. TaxID=2773926 RepID=UPI003AB32DD7